MEINDTSADSSNVGLLRHKFVSHQQNVGDDRPVEVERDLAEEDEGEAHEDVDARVEEGGEDEQRREEEAGAANDRVCPRVLLLQEGAQKSPEWNAQHSGHHRDGAEDDGDAEMIDV